MADDERDPSLAARLQVQPLDDVTRRRLVANALRASEDDAGAPPAVAARPSRAWRWLAAAAVVVGLVAGIALLTSGSGSDDQTASRSQSVAVPTDSFDQALGAARAVGDFGDLDQAANLAALRAALEHPDARKAAGTPAAASAAPESAAPESAAGAGGSTTGSSAFSTTGCARGAIGTIVAQGTGTIDGRAVTVVLLEGAHGQRSIDALFHDACELRHLSGSG